MKRLLLIGFFLASPASAQTQLELNTSACAAMDAADADLNAVYRTLMDRLVSRPEAHRATRAAQRAWVAFRDADLAAQFAVPDGSTVRQEYGSMYTMSWCSVRERLTEARTAELRRRLPCPGGHPCPGE